MLIGIDASRALRKQRTGTEHYTAEIIKALVKLDKKNTYRLYSSMKPWGDMENLGPNVEWKVMPFARGWTLIRLSWEMLINPPDILFVPAHTLPLICPKRTLVAVHDLGFHLYPELYRFRDKIYHQFVVRFVKWFATHILTISEASKTDIEKIFHVPASKVTSIPLGFNPKDFRPATKDEVSPRKEPYFYFVGRIEYRKNIKRILEAFAEFKQSTGLPHKLLLAGKPANGYEEIQETYRNLGPAKNDVEFLGYISQEDATRYLRHCHAFVFPTLFEGFGLPVLEAFASGVPVITSTTSSLPEVAGDAACLVDPWNPVAIADAMTKLATDDNLRSLLVEKGIKRQKEFTWERTAQETLDLIEHIARSRS